MNKTITKNLRKLRQGKRLTQEYVFGCKCQGCFALGEGGLDT